MSCFDKPWQLLVSTAPATNPDDDGDAGHVVTIELVSIDDPDDRPCPACAYRLMLEATAAARTAAVEGDMPEPIGRA